VKLLVSPRVKPLALPFS